MNEEEETAKIKCMKAMRGYILESRRNLLADMDSHKTRGYVWCLRLDTRFDYSLDVFTQIKETLGANSISVEYKGSLWLKLFFYENK